MQVVSLFLLSLIMGWVQAETFEGLRLIQAQADMPNIELWLNLPDSSSVKPEQFSLSVGAEPARLLALDSFRQTEEGVAFIFLVDVSKSLHAQQFEQIKRALHQWVIGMRKQDTAALMTVGREVETILGFTSDQPRLMQSIDALGATDQETSLYRGVLAAAQMGRLQAKNLPARRAIILLSDGMDDAISGVTVDEVLKQSQEYRIPLYSIGFAVPPLSESKRQGLKVLSILSRQSGGFFVQAEADQLENAYQQLYRDIMQSYRLMIDCAACQANGQLMRLNVAWNDGQHILNEGLDIRLLPEPAASQTASSLPVSSGMPLQLLVGLLAFIAFLTGLILIYRQRLAYSHQDQEYLTISDQPASFAQSSVLSKMPHVLIRFTVVSGVQKGRQYQLEIVDQAVIGRAANCALCLDDDTEISAQHVLLLYKEGCLRVRDLNSTNGTLVNGVPIHNEFPLRDKDMLLLGRTELRVEFSV